jgi:hypothetical protein
MIKEKSPYWLICLGGKLYIMNIEMINKSSDHWL